VYNIELAGTQCGHYLAEDADYDFFQSCPT